MYSTLGHRNITVDRCRQSRPFLQLPVGRSQLLKFLENVQSVSHLADDHVFLVQMQHTNVFTLTSFTMQLYKNSEIVRKRTFSRVTSTSCTKVCLRASPRKTSSRTNRSSCGSSQTNEDIMMVRVGKVIKFLKYFGVDFICVVCNRKVVERGQSGCAVWCCCGGRHGGGVL